jgi:hypothetical protein
MTPELLSRQEDKLKRGIFLALLLAACPSARVQIRPGPPVRPVFAPPPGLIQIIRTDQERTSKLEFSDQTGQSTTLRDVADVVEKYERLTPGGFRVSRTLTRRAAVRDGQPVAIQDPFIDVTEIFTIDAQGKFLVLENGEDVLKTARDRTKGLTEKHVMEILKPEMLEALLKDTWQKTYGGLCDQDQAPGAASYAFEAFSEPAINLPIHAIVKQLVVGRTDMELTPAVEVNLKFAGADSELGRSAAAREFLMSLPQGPQMLSPKVEGEGRRLVSIGTCQTFSEDSNVRGEIPLPDRNTEAGSAVVPKLLRFQLHNKVLRLTPSGAI